MRFPLMLRSRHRQLAEEAVASARREAERRISELAEHCDGRQAEIERLQAQARDLSRSRIVLLDGLSLSRASLRPFAGPAVPVVVGVDVEPDARVVDLADPSWRSTALFFEKMPRLRRQFAEASGGSGLRVTWFPRADPQVAKANGNAAWALEHFGKDWQAVRQAGDEIGLHMHPWRWDDHKMSWCQDHAAESWVLSCLDVALNAYRHAFGGVPAAYRGGDRFLSNALAATLLDRGVEVDLTLERLPATARLVERENGTGSIPDGTGIPLHAYHASAQDFRTPATHDTGLGMMPLTAYGDGTLVPWLPNTVFETELDRLLLDTEAAAVPTHLAFVARSDLATDTLWANFVGNLMSLARRVREGRLTSVTGSEAWRIARPRSQDASATRNRAP